MPFKNDTQYPFRFSFMVNSPKPSCDEIKNKMLEISSYRLICYTIKFIKFEVIKKICVSIKIIFLIWKSYF